MMSNQSMRAIQKPGPAPGIAFHHASVPQVGSEEVLIRVLRTAICGTDLHIYKWDEWASSTVPAPMIIGHEFSGEIVDIGSHVRRPLEIGTLVSAEGHIIGGESRAVRAGRYHLDPETKGIGVDRPGAFADFISVPAFNVVPLPAHVDAELGAILDPFGNAAHTALSFDLVGEDVLVTGAGPIGIMAAAICRHAGARHVVLTDINPYRLDLATQLADVHPVNVAEQDLKSEMEKLRIVEGFDVGLEMSGVSSAFDQMVDLMRMGGQMGLLGVPAGKTQVDWSRVIFKALTLKGVYGREMYETWYKMFAMLEAGLNLKPLITHRFKPEQAETAFQTALSGESGKVLLEWS